MSDPATIEERLPGYPHNPEYYKARPDGDPERVWFEARGAQYRDGEYLGGFALAPGFRPIQPPDADQK